ncbi:MAG: metallophosphoesterase family protein, partial [Anaerolineaceae bacterium]
MSTGRDQNFAFIRLILAFSLAVSLNLLWFIPTFGDSGPASSLNGITEAKDGFRSYYPAVTANSALICDASIPPPIYDKSREAVVVGAGDIATCANDVAAATSQLLDAVDGTVITLGDNVQGNGTDAEYANCYDPTWGRHKSRTYPVPGNHDYGTNGGSSYYDYFGAAAGDPEKGYYSYDLGDWHIIALNSQVDVSAGSVEEQWLRADLAAHPTTCTLAYWHDPLFSSGAWSGGDEGMKALWQALYDYGVDIVLNG